MELQSKVKQAGAKWNPKERVEEMDRDQMGATIAVAGKFASTFAAHPPVR